jgi:sec-independent protein translocase protein TatA
MNPFNLGPFELVFVLIVLLLLFGAKRLPELGSGLGKGIREFKRSMSDIKGEIERNDEPNRIHQPPPSSSFPTGEPRKPAAEEPRPTDSASSS